VRAKSLQEFPNSAFYPIFVSLTNIIMHSREEKLAAYGRFLDVLDELREKCPWDRKQTNQSLRPNTIEECFELCDALIADDTQNICKELGDVLLHVAFYAKIASEKEQFDMKDVCDRLCEKLIYRHPHVFGDAVAETAGEVCKNWEQLKMTEKDGNKSLLSGVPNSMPSLIKAYRMQEKAANVGFDWDNKEDVWAKVHEEVDELQAEMRSGDKAKMEKEFGDLLFSLVNVARHYGINPDNALEMTNAKFRNRFGYVEEHSIKQGRNLKDMSLEEMDALWNDAKREGL
jgi:XTP/dITP diphosphohydrolase